MTESETGQHMDTRAHIQVSGSFSGFTLWPHILLAITTVQVMSPINGNTGKFGL